MCGQVGVDTFPGITGLGLQTLDFNLEFRDLKGFPLAPEIEGVVIFSVTNDESEVVDHSGVHSVNNQGYFLSF